MFASPIAAADEMRQMFVDAWEDLTIITPAPEVRWRGKEKKTDPLPTSYFCRFVIRGVGSPSAGFLENGEGPSPQVFDNYGNVFVQVFAPIDAVDSFRYGELLAIAARDIFQGASTAGGVWFRNARYSEVDDDGKFYCWNVVTEYEFSET